MAPCLALLYLLTNYDPFEGLIICSTSAYTYINLPTCKDHLEKFVVIAVLLEYQIGTKSMIDLAFCSLKIAWVRTLPAADGFFCFVSNQYIIFWHFKLSYKNFKEILT